ncbi:MAG TPA: hypothetical protein VGJ25_16230 [Gaiellaceae bacterium]|jgi:hypothetical protein
MDGELEVRDQVVDQTSRLTVHGNVVPVFRLRFRLGEHGPFTLEFDEADFTPEKIKSRQDRIRATLRGL